MCDPPRIYPSLLDYTPPFATNVYVRPSQNLPPPPSQNIPPFQQMYMCDPPRIYPSLTEYTPFSTNVYVRPSNNLPLPHRIYPPHQSIYMCDPPRIYPSLPEYTPFSTKMLYFNIAIILGYPKVMAQVKCIICFCYSYVHFRNDTMCWCDWIDGV